MSDVNELIGRNKQAVEEAKSQLLKTFAFVPDEKLGWSPAPASKSAVQIVSHCGMGNLAFAALLRGEPWALSMDPAVASVQIRESGNEIVSREEAVRLVEESAAAVSAALESVTQDKLSTSIISAFGPIPYAMCVTFPANHMSGHARQIDYLQTMWGDLQDHM